MDDVIALKVRRADGKLEGHLAWGRIFGALEEGPIIDALLRNLKLGSEAASDIEVCESLGEVSRATYFYEGLVYFAMRPIPFGPDYEQWRRARQEEYESGVGDFFSVGTLDAER